MIDRPTAGNDVALDTNGTLWLLIDFESFWLQISNLDLHLGTQPATNSFPSFTYHVERGHELDVKTKDKASSTALVEFEENIYDNLLVLDSTTACKCFRQGTKRPMTWHAFHPPHM